LKTHPFEDFSPRELESGANLFEPLILLNAKMLPQYRPTLYFKIDIVLRLQYFFNDKLKLGVLIKSAKLTPIASHL
jgi:hypothetical protein